MDADSLGIDLSSGKEPDLFKWFLLCLLFGKPIQRKVAKRAFDMLTNTGKITSIGKLANSSWADLVYLLDEAHYVRFDFSTATKLLEIAKQVKSNYGNIKRLLKQSENAKDLANRLQSFKGIGPVTASIFVRDVTPLLSK